MTFRSDFRHLLIQAEILTAPLNHAGLPSRSKACHGLLAKRYSHMTSVLIQYYQTYTIHLYTHTVLLHIHLQNCHVHFSHLVRAYTILSHICSSLTVVTHSTRMYFHAYSFPHLQYSEYCTLMSRKVDKGQGDQTKSVCEYYMCQASVQVNDV